METQLLCRWLNEDLRLSRIVEPKTFAKDFSSGYLIGEVLHKYNLQSDFSLFMKKDTAVSKLNNFTRLEPTLRLLRISFDTITAQDLMEEKPGVASRLLYQLYTSLEKNKKAEVSTTMMEIMQPATSAGQFKKEHEIFSERLHQVVKCDAELKLQKISQHYEEKDLRDPMGSYLTNMRGQQSINRPVENQFSHQRRSLKVQEDKKKSTDLNIQMPKPPAKNAPQLQQKKNQQLLQRKERQAEMVKAEIAQFETNRKKQVTSSFTSSPSSSGQPFPPDYHPGGSRKGVEVSGGEKKVMLQSNTKYIQEIRQRLEENAVASDQRDKRLNSFLMEQLKARDAQEEARREEQLIARLTRQTRQEQRLAAQLLQLRKQKDVIRENRLLREQQYQQRRERDFQEALDREAALAQQARLEREDDIRMQLELCKRMAAERAQSRRTKHSNICADILEQILDLTTKIGEYWLINQNLIPEKQMREWKELLFNGLPLYEPVKGHQPEFLTSLDPVEKEKQEILNNQDYDDYTNLTGDWAWPEEAGEAKSSPLNNDILGHVIQRLRTNQHQSSLEEHLPSFPPFTIKACVLSKYCAGKMAFLPTITEGLDISILSADMLVNEALNAYKEEQLSQILPSSVVTEQQDGGTDNQQLLTPLDSDVENQGKMECDTKLSSRAMKGALAEKELSEGNTISNELLVEIITEAIRELPAHSGWILDGFPLDITQAQLLEKALCGSVEEEKEDKIQRTNLAVDSNPPEPPPPSAPALDLALLLDFSDEQMVSHALSLMDEDNDVATASQQTDKLVYNAQVPHGIIAFQDAWPELEEWFGHKQNILVRVEVDVVDEEFYSKVKSVLQQVMEKRQKDPATPDEAVVEPDCSESTPPSSVTSGPEAKPAALTEKDGTSSSSRSSLKGENVQSDPSISKATGPSGNTSTSSLNEKDLHVVDNIKSESTASIPASSTQVSADQPISPEISKYLCPYWDMVCQSYVNNVKTVMERLRYQRTVFDHHNYIISERFKHILGRPDSRQELVSQMQKDFNNVPDDMRDDEENKTELHLRLDELRERLWDICDKRKEEDEQERATIMSDGWLEEQVSVVINLHSLLMQVELDRFQETLHILQIYYCSMCPNILLKPPSKMFYIPLTNVTNNQEVKDLDEGEEKCSRRPDSSVCNQTDEDKKIELIPLERSVEPSEEASLQSHEKLITDYEDAITAIENLVAAETQQWKKSKPEKEQTGVQSPTPSISQEVNDKIQQEHTAALQHEESAAKVRIALVKGHGLVMVRSLQSGVDECFGSMEKMLQEGYLTEMKSIDKLSEVVRHNIEAGTKLQNELVLGSCDFYLNGDHRLFESPPPPLRPPASEKPTGSTLTVVQLESLNQQLRIMAPSGLIYSNEFLCFLKDYILIRRGTNPTIEQWIEINERQLRDIVFLLTDDHEMVDWRRFLLSAALPWPPSSLSQLLEVLEKYKALDTSGSSYITEQQYAQIELWFSGDCNLVVPDDPSEPLPYDRLSNLCRFFFQLFADHEATPPKLNYMHMLLYFAADSNPRTGFIRALSLVLGQHLKDSSSSSPPSYLVKSMPSIQESAELTLKDLDGENKEDTQGEVDPEVSISDFLAAFCHEVDTIPKDSKDQNQEKLAVQLRQIFRELESDPEGRVPFSVLSQHPVIQALMESCNQYQLISSADQPVKRKQAVFPAIDS
ncbi:sperm flagellar protein 2 isoform X3 [Gouania willdenowi]|uniref:sperm flagellar protein 2 isoform X3 n=1 Tax=Gouania willdenowi TaxID=441366 RepID=UPI0010554721|nr:sperm flagellar protein 2 isoform X3 [Gouania willdenowi]